MAPPLRDDTRHHVAGPNHRLLQLAQASVPGRTLHPLLGASYRGRVCGLGDYEAGSYLGIVVMHHGLDQFCSKLRVRPSGSGQENTLVRRILAESHHRHVGTQGAQQPVRGLAEHPLLLGREPLPAHDDLVHRILLRGREDPVLNSVRDAQVLVERIVELRSHLISHFEKRPAASVHVLHALTQRKLRRNRDNVGHYDIPAPALRNRDGQAQQTRHVVRVGQRNKNAEISVGRRRIDRGHCGARRGLFSLALQVELVKESSARDPRKGHVPRLRVVREQVDCKCKV